MGPTALLPLQRKACWGVFRSKNPTASAGCEPVNLGTKGQHATSRPPKPLVLQGKHKPLLMHSLVMTSSTLSRSAKWTFSNTFSLILLKILLFQTMTAYPSCSHRQHRARRKKNSSIVCISLRLPAKWNADRSWQTNDEQTGMQLMKLLTGSWTTIKADKQSRALESLTNTAYAMKIQPLFAHPQLTWL